MTKAPQQKQIAAEPQSGWPDSNRRPPEPHYAQYIRHITGDSRFFAGFGENFLELKSPFPGIQGGYVLKKVLEGSRGSQASIWWSWCAG